MSHITSLEVGDPAPTFGVALDGAGWHPAAWREAEARADDLFTAEYWQDLIAVAEAAGVDYVTIEDALRLPSTGAFRTDGSGGTAPPRPEPGLVDGRLDALLTASWIAPRTRSIGVIPTVTTTHTEPFHVATALQTLDHVSEGRAGWQLRISAEPESAAAFGRRRAPDIDANRVIAGEPDAGLDELLGDAADSAEVARRLWDSWEDDAVIRDVVTGRFLDRARVHHIDFAGERFSVAGPSIVPRSPQGQLPITVLSHSPRVHELAAAAADIVFITPGNASARAGASRNRSVSEIIGEVRAAERAVDRASLGLAPLRIVADLVVAIDTPGEHAADRVARLDRLAGAPFQSDARIVAGSPEFVATAIAEWLEAGVDGVRLRPLALPTDLRAIAERLLPVLRERGIAPARGDHDAPRSLRERFGLDAAVNRYAGSKEVAA